MKVGIASDHAGYDLKEKLKELLPEIEWVDFGANSLDSVDYSDYSDKLCQSYIEGSIEKGILICGSGIGISIAANKYHKKIRAALCHDTLGARLTREHNNSNILCMGAIFTPPLMAKEMAQIWLNTEFSQGERHIRRIEKFSEM